MIRITDSQQVGIRHGELVAGSSKKVRQGKFAIILLINQWTYGAEKPSKKSLAAGTSIS
jgi:hypothetical protein